MKYEQTKSSLLDTLISLRDRFVQLDKEIIDEKMVQYEEDRTAWEERCAQATEAYKKLDKHWYKDFIEEQTRSEGILWWKEEVTCGSEFSYKEANNFLAQYDLRLMYLSIFNLSWFDDENMHIIPNSRFYAGDTYYVMVNGSADVISEKPQYTTPVSLNILIDKVERIPSNVFNVVLEDEDMDVILHYEKAVKEMEGGDD